MVDKPLILEALKKVYDPEIPVNLVDLGLIYDIKVVEGAVQIEMTLTAVGCPMSAQISNSVVEAVRAVDGVRSVKVDIVWDPPWSPERISPAGRLAMGMD